MHPFLSTTLHHSSIGVGQTQMLPAVRLSLINRDDSIIHTTNHLLSHHFCGGAYFNIETLPALASSDQGVSYFAHYVPHLALVYIFTGPGLTSVTLFVLAGIDDFSFAQSIH